MSTEYTDMKGAKIRKGERTWDAQADVTGKIYQAGRTHSLIQYWVSGEPSEVRCAPNELLSVMTDD